MKNIEITSNALFYIIKDISEEVELGYINSIQAIDYDTVKIKVHKKQSKQLIITKNLLYLSDYKIPVMDKSPAFIGYLKKKLDNQRIKKIQQNKNNKVFFIELDTYYLIFELFSNSNIILTDKDFKVISARRYERWKDREIIRNEIYKFPTNKDIKETNYKDIKEDLENKDNKELTSYIVKTFNIHPKYVKDIIEDKESSLELKFNLIKQLFDYKYPKVIVTNKNNSTFIDVEEGNEKNNLFSEIQDLFVDTKKQNSNKSSDKKFKKLNIIIETQNKTKKDFEKKIEDYKQQGEFVYANYIIIEQINKQIKTATEKKIDNKEIINKLNTYFKDNNYQFKITDIDLIRKKYTLKI